VKLLTSYKLTKKRVYVTIFIIIFYLTAVMCIQIIAPDRIITPEEFPESCPEKSMNCTMVGPEPYRGEGRTEIRFNSSMSEVIEEAKKWSEGELGTSILGEWDNQLHVVFRTLIWKFPDDFIINLHCENEVTVMNIYSKSRIGISDLGVNDDRVLDFTKHMTKVNLSQSKCT